MVELLVALVVDEVVEEVVYEVLPEVLFSGVSTARLCLVLEFDFSCLPFGFLLAATCSLEKRRRGEEKGITSEVERERGGKEKIEQMRRGGKVTGGEEGRRERKGEFQ